VLVFSGVRVSIKLRFGSSAANTLIQLMRDPDNYFHHLASGKVGAISLNVPKWMGTYYFVTDPEFSYFIFSKSEDIFIKTPFVYKVVQAAIGNGILTSGGSLWRQQRKLVNPSFQNKCLHQYEGSIIALVDEWLVAFFEASRQKLVVNVSEQMTRITMSIILETMFSSQLKEDSEAISQAVLSLNRDATRKIKSFMRAPMWVPTPLNRRIRKSRSRIEAVVHRVLDEKRTKSVVDGDLADRLINNARSSKKQMLDELMTIFLGGHETTSSLLTYTFYCLARHPDIQERLREHILATLDSDELSFRALNKFTYVENVIFESIRMYAPIISPVRTSSSDFEFAGESFRKGDHFFLCLWSGNMNPKIWPDPERFDPDRFESARLTESQRKSFLPFGAGPRVCVGRKLSLIEAKIVLIKVLSRFRVCADENYTLDITRNVTTCAQKPFFAHFEQI